MASSSLPIVTAPCVPTIEASPAGFGCAARESSSRIAPRSIPNRQLQIGQFPRRIFYPPSVEIRSFMIVPVQYLSENLDRTYCKKPRQTPDLRSFVLRVRSRAPEDRRSQSRTPTGTDNRAPPNNCGTLVNPAATLRKTGVANFPSVSQHFAAGIGDRPTYRGRMFVITGNP